MHHFRVVPGKGVEAPVAVDVGDPLFAHMGYLDFAMRTAEYSRSQRLTSTYTSKFNNVAAALLPGEVQDLRVVQDAVESN